MDRFKLVTEKCNLQGKGLEIGPSFNPICAKRDGFDIEIMDCLDQEGLRKKYVDDPNVGDRVHQIEEVDYIWNGEDYCKLTGKKNYYDYILASNVIEHTTDLIGFLNQCSALLKSDGILSLVVPNKYCTFDFLRENSSLAQVIERHSTGDSTCHSKGAILDYYSNVVTLNGARSWNQEMLKVYEDITFIHTKEDALASEQRKQDVDIHEWVFTPGSFRILIHDLLEFGFIDLKEDSFYSDSRNSYEFFVSLKKGSPQDTTVTFNQERRQMLYNYKLQEDISALYDFSKKEPCLGIKGALKAFIKKHFLKSFGKS